MDTRFSVLILVGMLGVWWIIHKAANRMKELSQGRSGSYADVPTSELKRRQMELNRHFGMLTHEQQKEYDKILHVFFNENMQRFITLGIGAAIGFAYIINRSRREPDAQLPNRQVAGWVLILIFLFLAIALTVWVFMKYGGQGGALALVGASIAGGLLVLLAGRK